MLCIKKDSVTILRRYMHNMLVINYFPDLEKAELFMELYGNVVMNSHALEYLKNKSNDLIRYIYIHMLLSHVVA